MIKRISTAFSSLFYKIETAQRKHVAIYGALLFKHGVIFSL